MRDKNEHDSITDILSNILHFFQAGRCYIFEFFNDNRFQRNTYEIVSKGVEEEINMLQKLESSELAWWTNKILKGDPIIINSIDELPPEANNEKVILRKQGIRSALITPMTMGEKIWGYMGIDFVDREKKWTNEDYQWFSSLSNIISICIELKRAQRAEHKEHAFLHNLFKFMPLGYVHLSVLRNKQGEIVDYIVTEANDLFTNLFGISRANFIGKKGSETETVFALSDSIGILKDVLEKNTTKEADEYIEQLDRYIHKIIYSPEKDQIVELCSDTTEKVKASNALKRSEAIFKNIVANIPVGLEIYDKNGLLIDQNLHNVKIFGLENDYNDLGINLFEDPNFSPEIRERIKNENNTEFNLHYSFAIARDYIRSKDKPAINLYAKSCKLLDEEGKCSGYLMLYLDNIDSIEAENKIRDFEKFFLLISEYAKVGYAKINPINGKGYAIRQWYKNWEEDENKPVNEIMGIYNNAHPDDRTRLVDAVNDIKKGIKKNFSTDVRVLKEGTDDQWKWIHINIILSRYMPESGEADINCINYDITELKETERALVTALDKAQAADKLKISFIANMSHEIRTPLNAITGFADLITMTSNVEEQKQYSSIIHNNTELLIHLLSDIIDLSTIESGNFNYTPSQIDINELLGDIAQMYIHKVNEPVKFIFNKKESKDLIFSDRDRIRQVIANFIDNAIKFTKSGSITLCYEKVKNGYKFSVCDTGLGIPVNKQQQIFDRFVKLDSFMQGTGLGLSICQTVIEELGGNIGVDSEVGKGSCFWFVLPYKK